MKHMANLHGNLRTACVGSIFAAQTKEKCSSLHNCQSLSTETLMYLPCMSSHKILIVRHDFSFKNLQSKIAAF